MEEPPVLIQVSSAPEGAPAGSVTVTISTADLNRVMVVPQIALPVLLNRLMQFFSTLAARGNQPEARPIPEAMLVECEPRVGDTCMVCLEEHTTDDGEPASPWVSLSRCGHRFHPHCIRQWQRPLCPVCRATY
jgi:hypothetical protein